jgi:1,2-diacylglycerol 3-alpha-glucosyltransferase
MRILICGTTYYPGLNGQAIFTVNLAEGLAKRGHEVTVVFPSDEGRAYRRTQNLAHLEGIRSIKLTFLHPDTFISVFSARTIHRLLDAVRPEIVHIQDHYPLCRAFAQETIKRGIKIIGTNHFMPQNIAPYIPGPSILKPAIDQFLWKWMLDVYDRLEIVTTQSRAAADIVRAQGLCKPVFPVSCGIDLKRFHPDPSVDRLACRARYGIDLNRTIFLFVGRVDKEKRVDVLLRALHRLGRDDIQLVIAGRGAASNDLEVLAKSLNLGNRVRFTGFIPNEDLHLLLNSVDIFTMPSEAELLSIASLEAMACARPVLLADAVALPELVTHGINGYLFKPGNVDDAAHYMALLADQRERWEQMGQASLQKAQVHSLENTIQRYETLYKETIR